LNSAPVLLLMVAAFRRTVPPVHASVPALVRVREVMYLSDDSMSAPPALSVTVPGPRNSPLVQVSVSC
jgi:hypothetical protein